MTSHITTHVLDATSGRPAEGVLVRLFQLVGEVWEQRAEERTNTDGRIPEFGPEVLELGTYRVWFGTGEYFANTGQPTFYPEVGITVDIESASQHYHVPLLLSPYAYSTYRGS